jgi:hypothetical protein
MGRSQCLHTVREGGSFYSSCERHLQRSDDYSFLLVVANCHWHWRRQLHP